jgi:hypothetical protein
MSKLPLTDQIDALIAEGKINEAEQLRSEVTSAAFENAQAGAVINLSDLMAGAEQVHIARHVRR